MNLHFHPWIHIPIGIYFIIFFAYHLYFKKKWERKKEIDRKLLEAIFTPPEVLVKKRNEKPSYGDCVLYYRDYKRKFYDRGWRTDEPKPFEVYREEARRYGWNYLFSTTADFMVGTPFSKEGFYYGRWS